MKDNFTGEWMDNLESYYNEVIKTGEKIDFDLVQILEGDMYNTHSYIFPVLDSNDEVIGAGRIIDKYEPLS